MNRRASGAIWLAAFLLVCSAGIIRHAVAVYSWGNRLDSVDTYSESNTVREVQGFLDQGLWANRGLGNVLYGGAYPTEGFVGYPEQLEGHVAPGGVYTHYPPGPEYLLYAVAKIFGLDPLSRLRALPLLISLSAVLYVGLRLRSRFGAGVAWVVMVGCLLLPIFSNASAQLHYIGYATAFLLIEIGLCLGRNSLVTPFLLLGFIQGWLSFDYFFLVALAPIAVNVAVPRIDPTQRSSLKLAAFRSIAAASGFAAAHALHFIEVWAYLGTLQAALQDLHHAATVRSNIADHGILMAAIRIAGTIYVFWIGNVFPKLDRHIPYLSGPGFQLLGLGLGTWWIIMIAASLVAARWANRGLKFAQDWLIVCLCGFVPSSLWMAVMARHAIFHQHIVLRHLFFAFFLTLIFLAHRVLLPAFDRIAAAARGAKAVQGMASSEASAATE